MISGAESLRDTRTCHNGIEIRREAEEYQIGMFHYVQTVACTEFAFRIKQNIFGMR